MGWLKETVPEDLATLLRDANLFHIPTLPAWDEVKVGSGDALEGHSRYAVKTGVTANSSALAACDLFGFNVGTETYELITWNKKLYVMFNYCRYGIDVESVARVQLKQSQEIGALADKGIGMRVDSFGLVGESYGTELGTVDLAATLTSLKACRVVIILYPGSKIEWYVNGVLKGTQSTASKIPGGSGSTRLDLVHSIANGATGGQDVYAYLMQPTIWQAR